MSQYLYEHKTRTVVFLPEGIGFAGLSQWLFNAQPFWKARGASGDRFSIFDKARPLFSIQMSSSYRVYGPGITALCRKGDAHMGFKDWSIEFLPLSVAELFETLDSERLYKWGRESRVISMSTQGFIPGRVNFDWGWKCKYEFETDFTSEWSDKEKARRSAASAAFQL